MKLLQRGLVKLLSEGRTVMAPDGELKQVDATSGDYSNMFKLLIAKGLIHKSSKVLSPAERKMAKRAHELGAAYSAHLDPNQVRGPGRPRKVVTPPPADTSAVDGPPQPGKTEDE